ncbi:hypothetical protein H310_04494 [Aphanomyces invadans]|uniref:Protein phosphatase inhibitor 2 n=1 Tax=Aphanomyces invadans TaxID=157072 RepID=A0A024UCI5_9STRA|nr:hypothetical protein H310_04494 [Aphanomyces invadans]ETW04136.1 hypothetical protein H310_04494 [Aphanomyces invadans]|eukprot:XP_008867092.1 hypothetical protein H310_04494 [Aphanomyces invadans]
MTTPPSKAARPRIKWDEETIALHDLDRGTRMKIEEPNTPYHYYATGEEDMNVTTGNDVEITDVALQLHNATHSASELSELPSKAPVSPAHSASNGIELKWDELHARLEAHQSASKSSEWDSDSDTSSTSRKHPAPPGGADNAFAQKRKQHYNEFERMKQWRLQHGADDDDDA